MNQYLNDWEENQDLPYELRAERLQRKAKFKKRGLSKTTPRQEAMQEIYKTLGTPPPPPPPTISPAPLHGLKDHEIAQLINDISNNLVVDLKALNLPSCLRSIISRHTVNSLARQKLRLDHTP